MQLDAERKNCLIFATNLIIHCTGCEQGGPIRPDELTESTVQEVERIASRIRTWYNNHAHRQLTKQA